MELDDLKAAWKTLDERLERQNALGFALVRETRLDRMRRGLRPLVWGQAIQMLIGAAGCLLFGSMWTHHLHDPAALIGGLVMHVYCIGLIVVGALVESQIARIDHSAPVLVIQRQLLKLRRTYAVGGALAVGLPWWFLTAPLLLALTGGRIMDTAPSVIWIQLAIGAAGLLATWWFHRWAHRPERAALGRKLDENAAGGSLRRAQMALDEIAAFEQE
ncbi:MAG TPA: hypothetical protein VGH80_05670 [Xanthomonadaceae bacterium]|jgi:hypothetical protein